MLVFVYGTLMRDYYNNHIMERAGGTFVSEAHTTPNYDLVGLGAFPGMVEGEYQVAGEIWNVEDLEPLDRLEGHPTFYRREQIIIEEPAPLLGTLQHPPVVSYLYQGGHGSPIEHENGVKEWRE